MLKQKQTFKGLLYLAVFLFVGFSFVACEKNNDELVATETPVEQKLEATASGIGDTALKVGITTDTTLQNEPVSSNAARRWWWDNNLVDTEFFPLNAERYTNVSVPAGETRVVKFRVSDVGKYRVVFRHSTVGVTLRMRRYRGNKYLAGHGIPGNTNPNVYTETNGRIAAYQGSSADGDVMKIEIENTSRRDVNDLIVNWDPFAYGR